MIMPGIESRKQGGREHATQPDPDQNLACRPLESGVGYRGDAPHSLTVGGGSAVPGGRMARGKQPRPGEQLLAQGARQVVTFVDAAFLQDRHDQIDEVLKALGGHDAAEVETVDIGFFDPGDQVAGDLLGRTDDRRIAAAQPHPADYSPQRPGFGAQRGQGLDR
jgi:hypothetical protein